jgi:hypothetical protein
MAAESGQQGKMGHRGNYLNKPINDRRRVVAGGFPLHPSLKIAIWVNNKG